MKQLNSVIVEGTFKHFTSKKGALPMSFIVECNSQHFTISVKDDIMAEKVIENKPKNVRVIGRLDRCGRTIQVLAEHIEFKR